MNDSVMALRTFPDGTLGAGISALESHRSLCKPSLREMSTNLKRNSVQLEIQMTRGWNSSVIHPVTLALQSFSPMRNGSLSRNC